MSSELDALPSSIGVVEPAVLVLLSGPLVDPIIPIGTLFIVIHIILFFAHYLGTAVCTRFQRSWKFNHLRAPNQEVHQIAYLVS